jgi:hypothetical protein
MSNQSQFSEDRNLSATVERCLPTLQALSLMLDTYGNEADAANLHDVIEQLRRATPNAPHPLVGPMDFIVNGTFKVTRQQVANTLWHAFTGEITWFRIAETFPPRRLRFRSVDQTNPGIVDYPLNEGGSVRIVSTKSGSQVFEVSLDVVARGLEALANYYPRHFADLINENADALTANILLQCCLFGELIYD